MIFLKRGTVLLGTVLAPMILLILVTQIAVAQQPDGKQESVSTPIMVGDGVLVFEPMGERAPQQVTRIQTATIIPPDASLPLYENIEVIWENDWRNFDRSMGLVYPDDVMSTELELVVDPGITVGYGVYENGQKFVGFWPPEPNGEADYDVFMAYTSSVGTVFTDANDITYYFRVARETGSSLSVGALGGWLNTGFFQFTATMLFPSPFEFEWATAIPTDILTYTLQPGPDPHWIQWSVEDAVSFFATIMVHDPRLKADLVIEDLDVNPPDPLAGTPVEVTAWVKNNGVAMPETYFYTEWYQRPVGLSPPSGPDDHDYGWCGDPGVCADARYEFIFDANPATPDRPPDFPDPILTKQLLPGEVFTLTRVYRFPDEGNFELYAFVDVDVQHNSPVYGQVVEQDESNNWIGPYVLTVRENPNPGGEIYLPLVLRGH